MEPIILEDEYVIFPDKDRILEALAHCILRGEFDDKFEILVSAVEQE